MHRSQGYECFFSQPDCTLDSNENLVDSLHSICVADYVVSLRHQELSAEDLKEKVLEKCEELLPRDIADNLTMGQHGANAILKSTLTHSIEFIRSVFLVIFIHSLLFLRRY